jgi:hypothetical protein
MMKLIQPPVLIRICLALAAAISLIMACSPLTNSTPDPLVPTIAALQTEQAALLSILVETPAPSPTPTASPQPTSTKAPFPSSTPLPGSLKLPQSLYFLALDTNGIHQIWRLEPDGSTISQLTAETRSLTDFDVSPRGDLAYVVWDTPQVVPRLIVQTVLEDSPQIIAELNGDGESIQHVRWLPDGGSLVFHRSVAIESPTSGETPQTASELVLYTLSDASFKVLLRSGPDSIDPSSGTMYTNESVEYDALNEWNVVYRVRDISIDGRYLLLDDSGGPFWLVYDLATDSVYHHNIRAVSADFNSNGLLVCLAGVTSEPSYLGKQALLCADVVQNNVTTYLNTPPWQPFGLDYWETDNAVVFLQYNVQEGESKLQVYGMNLSETEPLLLREEPFSFNDARDGTNEVIYTSQEDQENGMVVLTGQTPEMKSPGLVFVPLDTTKPIQFVETGAARQPRWGPIFIP